MKIIEEKGNLILEDVADFELADIFDCGQCFRWDRVDDCSYIGVACGRALLVEKDGNNVILHGTTADEFDRIWRNYFDFDRDYTAIKNTLAADSIMAEAMVFGKGIRILRQEPFESLISFIISASNNIPRIKGIITRLCENFGEPVFYMGNIYYTFPTPETLAKLELEQLSVIRAGFRDKYILAAAQAVANGEVDLTKIAQLNSAEAKTELMKLSGVGSKVSDCVLLFGLGKCDSFPIDVWVKRIMEHCYFGGKETKPADIAAYAAEHFGEYGGFAQQYLFFWARENKIGV